MRNEATVKELYDKLVPDAELLRETKRLAAQAVESRAQLSQAAIVTDEGKPGNERRTWHGVGRSWLRPAAAALCMVLLVAGIGLYSRQQRDFTTDGRFMRLVTEAVDTAQEETLPIAAARFRLSELSMLTPERLAMIAETLAGEGSQYLLAEATVAETTGYLATAPETVGMLGFYELRLKLQEVRESGSGAQVQPETTLLVYQYVTDAAADEAEAREIMRRGLPQEGAAVLVALYTGENGKPTDEYSAMLGLDDNAWVCYGLEAVEAEAAK